jgi:hypothetical protein
MLMLRKIIIKNMRNKHKKHSWAPQDLDMFLMVKRRNFKIIDVEM